MVMGSNPGAVYWMVMTFFTFNSKNCIACLKRPKINVKEAGIGSSFKKMILKVAYLPIDKNQSRLVSCLWIRTHDAVLVNAITILEPYMLYKFGYYYYVGVKQGELLK